MSSTALIPLAVIALLLAFEAYCLHDIRHRTGPFRYLSPDAWAAFSLLAMPLGGFLYLTVGRDDGPPSRWV